MSSIAALMLRSVSVVVAPLPNAKGDYGIGACHCFCLPVCVLEPIDFLCFVYMKDMLVDRDGICRCTVILMPLGDLRPMEEEGEED